MLSALFGRSPAVAAASLPSRPGEGGHEEQRHDDEDGGIDIGNDGNDDDDEALPSSDDDDADSRSRITSSRGDRFVRHRASAAADDDESHDENDDVDDTTDDDGGPLGTSPRPVDVEILAIGTPPAKLDSNARHCWSCFVPLRRSEDDHVGNGAPSGDDGDDVTEPSSSSARRGRRGVGFLYSTHTHPLLGIAICSVCDERTTAVECDVVDAELLLDGSSSTAVISQPAKNDDNDNYDREKKGRDDDDDEGTTTNACSWCGLDDLELGEHDTTDSIPCSDLLLCDACPRAFCVRCVILSRGGDAVAWNAVRRIINEDDEYGWKCPRCVPTSFLQELRAVHERCTATSSNTEDDDDDSDDESRIRVLLEELDYAEDAMEEAARHLDPAYVDTKRIAIETELLDEMYDCLDESREDVEIEVDAELGRYCRRWQTHSDRLGDTITRLHEELDSMDLGVMEGYYKYRQQKHGGLKSNRISFLGDNKPSSTTDEEYVLSADRALAERDVKEGFSKGEFRGASGYKPKDARVYKLEPEDLNEECLNEIEDVNTLDGAISQMQSNANESSTNPWRSKTGTTEMDIEMFRNKAVKFENISLGGLIDLDILEKKLTTDNDDKFATLTEEIEESCRQGSMRVVKRTVPILELKTRARKESTTESRLFGDKSEYAPRLPPKNTTATVPKEKKRAELKNLSTGGASAFNRIGSGRLSPATKGILIGDSMAQYTDSNFKLKVHNCTRNVTLHSSLATLLKEHQQEGLKFCWRNVCSKMLMEPTAEDGSAEVCGSILAHNMGLGKSFQAVCLLHTLLTHPALVRTNGKRIVHTALLIAPVNTLANWETEFEKWVGASSGRSIPGVLFYTWNESKHRKGIVKEWHERGGILCVSTEKYASACKDYLDMDKRKPNTKQATSKNSAEEDAFLRAALFQPGPDIVVLDEVHSMLKSSSTLICKVLYSLGTRLRLGLTGSPIQNNLFEYYRMASWVKPNCLGSEAQFTKKYHEPIMDGMAADCTLTQAEEQERANNALDKILSEFVHRRNADVLAKELPYLQEAIIHVRQSKAQIKLYREFRKFQVSGSCNKNFFKQYHALRTISNHPAIKIMFEDKSKQRSDTPTFDESKVDDLRAKTDNQNQPRIAPEKYAWICDKCQVAKFRTLDEAEAHEETCDGTYNLDAVPDDPVEEAKTQSKADNEDWWTSFAERAEKSDLDIMAIEHSGKIVLLLQIIAHCDLLGDKVVVFSQSLPTLAYIEKILNSPDWGGFNLFLPDNVRQQKFGGWKRNQDYLRIDGSVDARERGGLIDTFHSDTAAGNQSKLFLLSTNAGGLGINLIAANRVVIFDSHWNPAVDLQAVYRCYRYGQTKPTYCYRLLAEGSMEQKIYSRAAAKTSLSDLVIDQTNPERSFTKQEMDLLRVEDTWVSCTHCNKWRMLPPDISAEEVECLPDEWYCEDNIWDPSRSSCSAEERSATWMVSFFERRAREADDAFVESQGFISSTKASAEARPIFDRRHQEYTERDTVLQNLIDRSEETTSSSGKKTWVSKWDFNFDKIEEIESAEEIDEPVRTHSPPNNMKLKSPNKMRLKSTAKMKKSPTIQFSGKMSPNSQTNKAPISQQHYKSPSPYEKIKKSSPGSSGKKRKKKSSLRKSTTSAKSQNSDKKADKKPKLTKKEKGVAADSNKGKEPSIACHFDVQRNLILPVNDQVKDDEDQDDIVDLTFSDCD